MGSADEISEKIAKFQRAIRDLQDSEDVRPLFEPVLAELNAKLAALHAPTDDRFATWMTPLAIPAMEYASGFNKRLRVWDACELVEMGLRIITFIGLCKLRPFLSSASAELSQVRSGLSDPSMSAWRAMAEQVVDVLGRIDDYGCRDLHGTLRPAVEVLAELVGTQRSRPSESLLQIRNDFAHGRINSVLAEEIDRDWQEGFARAMDAIEVIARKPLLSGDIRWVAGTRREADRAAEGGDFHDVELALGEDGERLPLSPFLVSVGADACDARAAELRIYHYDRKGPIYSSVTYGGVSRVNKESLPAVRFAQYRALLSVLPSAHRCLGPPREVQHIFDDARDCMARSIEIEAIHRVIDTASRNAVFWLNGVEAVGKSMVMARLMRELIERTTRSDGSPADLLTRATLGYSFRHGSPDCNRTAFLCFLGSRLSELTGRGSGAERNYKIEDVVSGVDAAARGRGIVILIDGLDIIATADLLFLSEIVQPITAAGGVWLFASRPDAFVRSTMVALQARDALSEVPVTSISAGLGRMSETDIRELLLRKIGHRRTRQLIKEDCDVGEQVENSFIKVVVRNANGMALYLKALIDDIERGVIADFGPETQRRLPREYAEYVNRIVAHFTDPRSATAQTVLGIVTLAFGDLSFDAILDIYSRSSGKSRLTSEQLQAAINSFPQFYREQDFDGTIFVSIHHSETRKALLENHETTSWLMLPRIALATIAEKPGDGAAAAYGFRRGVRHLVEYGKGESAANLLCRLDYLVERFDYLVACGIAIEDILLEITGDFSLCEPHMTQAQKRTRQAWLAQSQILLEAETSQDIAEILEQFAPSWGLTREGEGIARPPRPITAVEAGPQFGQIALAGHRHDIVQVVGVKGSTAASGWIVSADRSGIVRCWDRTDGVSLGICRPDPNSNGTHIIDFAGLLAVGQGLVAIRRRRNPSLVWRLPRWEPTDRVIAGSEIVPIAIDSPQGLAAGADDWAIAWDGGGGIFRWNIETGALLGRSDQRAPVLGAVALDLSAARGVVVWLLSGEILVLDETLRQQRALSAKGPPAQVVAVDRTVLVRGFSGELVWYDGCKEIRLQHRAARILAATMSRENEVLIVDAVGNTLSARRLPDGRTKETLRHHPGLRSAVRDGTSIVALSETGLLRVSADAKWAKEEQNEEYFDLVVDRGDSGFAAIARQRCCVFFSPFIRGSQRTIETATLAEEVVDAVSTDGGQLVVWGKGGGLRLLNGGPTDMQTPEHRGPVCGLRTISEQFVLSWSRFDQIHVSRIGDLSPVHRKKCCRGRLMGCLTLAETHVLTWGDDGALRVWAIGPEGTLHFAFGRRAHVATVNGVVAVDADTLLSWSDDGTVRVWTADTAAATLSPGRVFGEFYAPLKSVTVLPGRRFRAETTLGTGQVWSLDGDVPLEDFSPREEEGERHRRSLADLGSVGDWTIGWTDRWVEIRSADGSRRHRWYAVDRLTCAVHICGEAIVVGFAGGGISRLELDLPSPLPPTFPNSNSPEHTHVAP